MNRALALIFLVQLSKRPEIDTSRLISIKLGQYGTQDVDISENLLHL